MDPNMLQALIALLQSNNPSSNLGQLGTGGEFTTDPSGQLAEQIQVGGSPLQTGGMSPASIGQQPQMGQMPQGQQGVPGMQQPLQAGHTNAINSGQGHSSMMSPPTPQSIAQYLNQPQGMV